MIVGVVSAVAVAMAVAAKERYDHGFHINRSMGGDQLRRMLGSDIINRVSSCRSRIRSHTSTITRLVIPNPTRIGVMICIGALNRSMGQVA